MVRFSQGIDTYSVLPAGVPGGTCTRSIGCPNEEAIVVMQGRAVNVSHLFAVDWKTKRPQDSLLVSPFPIATTHATVKQAKAK
jgi:hypothetical protein